jgi:glycosyltransferase involved in cell wall biosynthesis
MHKIVVAKWLGDTLRRDYGDSHADLVPNGIDKALFHAPPRGKQTLPTVGFVYSTMPLKGLDVLLPAMQALKSRLPGVRCVVFGAEMPGPRLPLPCGASFHFRPAQAALKGLYAQCDVWLTASRSEGFNLPAAEAMACRTPVIATRTGWPLEAICSWHNGVLVDFDDAQGIAAAAFRLLSLPDGEWRELSERAYRTAATLSWEESAGRFERALFRACSRAARGEIAGRPSSIGSTTPDLSR